MRRLLFTLVLLGITWCGCLVWFIQTIPTTPAPITMHADAIIVLTGGNGRVERGLESLGQGAAPVLFVSGVGQHVTLPQLLSVHASHPTQTAIAQRGGEIVLDYLAASTQSNASEAAAFVRERHLHTVRLVTANYHMPRSLLEFRMAMPDVYIIADPVMPEGFLPHRWWQDEVTRRLILSEFSKYFAAVFLRLTA